MGQSARVGELHDSIIKQGDDSDVCQTSTVVAGLKIRLKKNQSFLRSAHECLVQVPKMPDRNRSEIVEILRLRVYVI
jgi:hypothetical protein